MVTLHVPDSKYFCATEPRYETKFIALHNIGVAGQTALQAHRYFSDPEKKRYAGIQFCVDLDGTVYEFADRDCVVYHVGGKMYTPYMLNRYHEYTLNEYKYTPNWISCGVEMCHPGEDGKPTAETLAATQALVKELLTYYHLTGDNVLRHYDVTGKNCPAYYVTHFDAWRKFQGVCNG